MTVESGVQIICKQTSQYMVACWGPWRMKRLLKECDEGMEWWVALFCWCLDEASWDLCTIGGAAAAVVYLWESSGDNQDCLHALPRVPESVESLLVENHSSEAELQMAGQPLCHPCLSPASTTRPCGWHTTVIMKSPAFVREAKAVCTELRHAPFLYGCVPVNFFILLLIYFLIGV